MNRTLYLGFTTALVLGATGGWVLRGVRDSRLAISPVPLLPPPASMPGVTPLPASSAPSGPIAFKTGASAPGNKPTSKTTETPAPMITADLPGATQDGTITVEFRGNGRDRLRMMAINHAKQGVRLLIPAGQAFEGANGTVVVLRSKTIEFDPGENRIENLVTVAAASTNRVADGTFVPSTSPQPKIQAFLEYISDHPEVSTPCAQTAALCILENLPVSAFAKFAEAGNDLPKEWDTTAFRVDTVDIIQALILLRQMGIPDDQLAITIDPQTKIEAMIDPMAHALAMRYYNIKPSEEWAYWKHELLQGDPSTRHYALHGIARYFPDVALPMLPQWAREQRTSQIFRLVAIQALAETQSADALPVLLQLEQDLGPQTELGKAAHEAASFLGSSLTTDSTAIAKRSVGFRVGKIPSAL